MPRIKAGARVLLVDDHPISRRLALKQLEKIGCDVLTASNGKQALDMVFDERFDLVLMDCYMPLMDGFAVTKAIRESEALRSPRVPIVAMTASAQPEDVRACLAAGMDDCIAKPVVLRELERIMERWVELGDTQAATLNIERIEAIFQDDAYGIRDLLHASVTAIAEDMRLLAETIEQGDAAGAKNSAHALKGASATIGAERLSLLAAAIEEGARGSWRLPEMRRMLFALQTEHLILQASISSYCSMGLME